MAPQNEDDSSVFSSELGLPSNKSDCETRTTDESPEEDRLQFQLAKEETKRVRLSKFLVLFVLLISAIVVSISTYVYISSRETKEFQEKFEAFANEIIKVSKVNGQNIFDAFETTSRTFTAFAIGTNSTWPFVTMTGFEAQTEHFVDQLKAQFVSTTILVSVDEKEKWDAYSVANQGWINESLAYRGEEPTDFQIVPYIFRLNYTDGTIYNDTVTPPEIKHGVTWQVAPVSREEHFINYNVFDDPTGFENYILVNRTRQAYISKVQDLTSFDTRFGANWPLSIIVQPIFDKLGDVDNAKFVALVNAFLAWHIYFENILAPGTDGITLVVRNKCNQTFSYQIDGPDITYLGPEDMHDRSFDDLAVTELDVAIWRSECPYSLYLYPTDDFSNAYKTDEPLTFAIAGFCIFLLAMIVFFLYDCLVQQRQQTVMTSAAKTGAIVDSFFPEHIRDQVINVHLIESRQMLNNDNSKVNLLGTVAGPFQSYSTKPIASLHPHCTIMVADIANFTAWSSVREPAQVFTLLETLYSAFDVVAKRKHVFKVETIGDSYVAVAGLPEPRRDHAVVMARFAQSCMVKMNEIVRILETSLGIGTSDLAMRYGLHSGPVTAGVLRGERSRFQLFGDTINTAARIESTGMANKIQISQQAADELKAAGKGDWLVRREEKVVAKGKGELQTYWLRTKNGSVAHTHTSVNGDPANRELMGTHSIELSGKVERLCNWHVDVLSRLLKRIVAMRPDSTTSHGGVHLAIGTEVGHTVLDEVKEIIELPNQKAQNVQDPKSIELNDEVMRQLTHYVTTIASMYRSNPFHSFEHASHVAQSLTKLLSRVVAEDTVDYTNMSYKKETAEMLHKFTYGIASDPLTQFACAFSALIHDVDHRGVPNAKLVDEEPDLARLYKGKSVAEQNSVDLAWELLMEPGFSELRSVIYTDQSELDRFRQLVVNSVMATDIVDKELGALRKKRWNKAFKIETDSLDGGTSLEDESDNDTVNRKATIVIEHLIQAADVAHTMQHWHVYLKWNERFFHENYQAYLEGRLDNDPSIGWYEGEIGFFDFYIIPLAKKLESCGVFGVSSDECLDYATANRNEWKIKGKTIVEGYMLRYEKKE